MELEMNDNFIVKNETKSERPPLALETAFTTFWSLAVAFTALLVYIIMRFRRLRTTTNLFLANWLIADLISLALKPASVVLFTDTHFDIRMHCFIMATHAICDSIAIVFQTFMIIDWLYKNKIVVKYVIKWKKSVTICIIATWTTVILSYLTSTLFCPREIVAGHGIWISLMLFILLTTLLVTSHTINCCRNKNKNGSVKNYTGLVLVTVYVTFTITEMVYIFTADDKFAHIKLFIMEFCSSIAVFICLCFLEKDFSVCLKQFCKCNAKEIDDEDMQRNVTNEQCQKCGKEFNVPEEL